MRVVSRFAFGGVLALALASCQDSRDPATVDLARMEVPPPALAIVDGGHGGGSGGFYFLPPLVTHAPSPTGTFDNTLLEHLEVKVCELAGDVCALGGVSRSFTSTTGSFFDRLRLFPDRQYVVFWATSADDLSPDKLYRITVLAHGVRLGYADVDVVASMADFRSVDRENFAVLYQGMTLPIAFRVEEAVALGGVGPGGVGGGLRVWLRAGDGVSTNSAGGVVEWADLSGHHNDAVWTGGGAFEELPPVPIPSNPGVRNEPTLRFEAQNALELDLTWLAGSDYTIVVANGRDRDGNANFYIAGDAAATNEDLVLGYERPDLLRQAHFSNDLDAVVEGYSGTEVWSLDTYRFEQAAGRDLYHNGAPVATDDNTVPLLANTGTTLGHFRAFPVYWFQGDLAEVVVYDRALSPGERLRVEGYLAGRYGYPISVGDYVPCDATWASHDEYMAAYGEAIDVLVWLGALTPAEGEAAKAAAEASSCGTVAAPLVDVSAGSAHTCALDDVGQAFCWGRNVEGELGDGTTDERTSPTPTAQATGVTFASLHATGQRQCALTDSGAPWCWGRDRTASVRTVPAEMSLPPGVAFADLGLMTTDTCGLTGGGQLWCKGVGYFGTGGFATYSDFTQLTALPFYRDLARGDPTTQAACVLDGAGRAWCWGSNVYGEIGSYSFPLGGFTASLVSVEQSSDLSFLELAGGAGSMCGLGDDGQAWCWGRNDHGQLGDGTGTASRRPVMVSQEGVSFTAIAASVGDASAAGHACAVGISGGLYCWGSNAFGQLGDGTQIDRFSPVAVALPDGADAMAVAVGAAHSCALSTMGKAYCWGRNEAGQLGDGTTQTRLTPVGVSR